MSHESPPPRPPSSKVSFNDSLTEVEHVEESAKKVVTPPALKGANAWMNLLAKGSAHQPPELEEDLEALREAEAVRRKNRRSFLAERYNHHRYLSLLEHNLSNRRTCIVQHPEFDNQDARELAQIIESYCSKRSSAHVSHLQISDCPSLTAEGYCLIINSLPGSCLERLTIDFQQHETGVPSPALSSTSNSNSNFLTMVSEMDVSENEETEVTLGSGSDSILEAVTSWLKDSNPRAKWVTLEGLLSQDVDPLTWQAFCKAAVCDGSLRALDLTCNQLDQSQAQVLADTIASSGSSLTLKSLTISEPLVAGMELLKAAFEKRNSESGADEQGEQEIYLIEAPLSSPVRRSTCCARASFQRTTSIGMPLSYTTSSSSSLTGRSSIESRRSSVSAASDLSLMNESHSSVGRVGK